jgi:hypothetical protein
MALSDIGEVSNCSGGQGLPFLAREDVSVLVVPKVEFRVKISLLSGVPGGHLGGRFFVLGDKLLAAHVKQPRRLRLRVYLGLLAPGTEYMDVWRIEHAHVEPSDFFGVHASRSACATFSRSTFGVSTGGFRCPAPLTTV